MVNLGAGQGICVPFFPIDHIKKFPKVFASNISSSTQLFWAWLPDWCSTNCVLSLCCAQNTKCHFHSKCHIYWEVEMIFTFHEIHCIVLISNIFQFWLGLSEFSVQKANAAQPPSYFLVPLTQTWEGSLHCRRLWIWLLWKLRKINTWMKR